VAFDAVANTTRKLLPHAYEFFCEANFFDNMNFQMPPPRSKLANLIAEAPADDLVPDLEPDEDSVDFPSEANEDEITPEQLRNYHLATTW